MSHHTTALAYVALGLAVVWPSGKCFAAYYSGTNSHTTSIYVKVLPHKVKQ